MYDLRICLFYFSGLGWDITTFLTNSANCAMQIVQKMFLHFYLFYKKDAEKN